MNDTRSSSDPAVPLWVLIAVLAPGAMASLGYFMLWSLGIAVVLGLVGGLIALVVLALRPGARFLGRGLDLLIDRVPGGGVIAVILVTAGIWALLASTVHLLAQL